MPEDLVGRRLALKLLEVDEERQRLVLSNRRRASSSGGRTFRVGEWMFFSFEFFLGRTKKKAETKNNNNSPLFLFSFYSLSLSLNKTPISSGDVVLGTVAAVQVYGAFVDLGGGVNGKKKKKKKKKKKFFSSSRGRGRERETKPKNSKLTPFFFLSLSFFSLLLPLFHSPAPRLPDLARPRRDHRQGSCARRQDQGARADPRPRARAHLPLHEEAGAHSGRHAAKPGSGVRARRRDGGAVQGTDEGGRGRGEGGRGSCSGCCCCCSGGRGGGGVKEDFEFWSFFFLASNFVFQLFESEHYALRERERTGRISKQQRESVRHFL